MPLPKCQIRPSKGTDETTLYGLTTVTPPSESIRSRKPVKSTSTTWFTLRPVSLSTVRMSSGGPPKANAALILFGLWPGIGTFRSRGIESIEIRCLEGSVRTSRIESDRAPEMAFAPRLSEPMIRLIWGLVRMLPAGCSVASVALFRRLLAFATSFEKLR